MIKNLFVAWVFASKNSENNCYLEYLLSFSDTKTDLNCKEEICTIKFHTAECLNCLFFRRSKKIITPTAYFTT